MAQLSRILSNEQVTPQGTFVSQPAITGIAQGLGNLGQSIQSIEQQESERKVQLFLAAKQAELNTGYMTGVSKIEQELDPNLSGDAYVKEYNKQEENLSKELLKSLNPEQRAVLEPVIQRNREQNIKYVINTAEQRQSQAYQLQLENGIKTLKDAYAATGLLGNPNIIATKQAEIASRITELWESFKPGLRLTDEQVKTGIQQTLEEAGAQAFDADSINLPSTVQQQFLGTSRYTSNADKSQFQRIVENRIEKEKQEAEYKLERAESERKSNLIKDYRERVFGQLIKATTFQDFENAASTILDPRFGEIDEETKFRDLQMVENMLDKFGERQNKVATAYRVYDGTEAVNPKERQDTSDILYEQEIESIKANPSRILNIVERTGRVPAAIKQSLSTTVNKPQLTVDDVLQAGALFQSISETNKAAIEDMVDDDPNLNYLKQYQYITEYSDSQTAAEMVVAQRNRKMNDPKFFENTLNYFRRAEVQSEILEVLEDNIGDAGLISQQKLLDQMTNFITVIGLNENSNFDLQQAAQVAYDRLTSQEEGFRETTSMTLDGSKVFAENTPEGLIPEFDEMYFKKMLVEELNANSEGFIFDIEGERDREMKDRLSRLSATYDPVSNALLPVEPAQSRPGIMQKIRLVDHPRTAATLSWNIEYYDDTQGFWKTLKFDDGTANPPPAQFFWTNEHVQQLQDYKKQSASEAVKAEYKRLEEKAIREEQSLKTAKEIIRDSYKKFGR